MADNPFKVGDVVELKSGSSPMTVAGLEGLFVYLVWSHGEKFERDKVSADCVKPSEARKGSVKVG